MPSDRSLAIRDIIEQVSVSFGSYQTNLSDHLDLRLVASQVVSKILKSFQSQNRLQVSQEIICYFYITNILHINQHNHGKSDQPATKRPNMDLVSVQYHVEPPQLVTERILLILY